MGLLDDAIREHLELMRRRGADPDALARSEDEALGDPRNPGPAPAAAAGLEDPRDAEPAAGAAFELDDPLQVPDFVAAPPDEPVERPAAIAASEVEPEPDAVGPDDERAWLEDEPEEQPAAIAASELDPQPEPVAPGDESGSDPDVLEETPDFLEETPEHDRLWFEQKPPRDFDFDN